MPNSPHDFTFRENYFCVNEGYLRVDGQFFPCYTEKIQLNHYFCRSAQEIELKLRRGGGARATAWPRKRFDVVNLLSTYTDTLILQNLASILNERVRVDEVLHDPFSQHVLQNMAFIARNHKPKPLELVPGREPADVRAEFKEWMAFKTQGKLAEELKDYQQLDQVLMGLLRLQPYNLRLYVDISINYLELDNVNAAWQALSRAWQMAPNSYLVLGGMAFFFLHTQNFTMAEKTCRLILEMAPHNLTILGVLTQALIGQGRNEEALKVGVPVVEVSSMVGELPEGMGISLVKKMAGYMLEQKDYVGAVRLWEDGVQSQPGDVTALLELIKILLLAGNKVSAGQRLAEAQALAPDNEGVRALIRSGVFPHRSKPVLPVARGSKRRR